MLLLMLFFSSMIFILSQLYLCSLCCLIFLFDPQSIISLISVQFTFILMSLTLSHSFFFFFAYITVFFFIFPEIFVFSVILLHIYACCSHRGQHLVKTEGLMELVKLQQSGTLGALSSLAQRGLMQVCMGGL